MELATPLSNPELINRMKTILDTGKETLYDKIINFVRKVFGIEKTNTLAYSAVNLL